MCNLLKAELLLEPLSFSLSTNFLVLMFTFTVRHNTSYKLCMRYSIVFYNNEREGSLS